MSDKVLVFVSANNCGACQNIAPVIPELEKLTQDMGVDFVKVNYINRQSPLDTSKYPAGLSKYINFFPTVMLIDRADWEYSLADTKDNTRKLNPLLANFAFVNGRLQPDMSAPQLQFTPESFRAFLEKYAGNNSNNNSSNNITVIRRPVPAVSNAGQQMNFQDGKVTTSARTFGNYCGSGLVKKRMW